MDYRILELLHSTRRVTRAIDGSDDGMWLKTNTIVVNLGASRTYISERLSTLHAGGMIERDEGFYRITDRGSALVDPDW